MSAYKDEDRFFKIVAVLQDRVGWKDPILLPVSDHLFICQSGDERVTTLRMRPFLRRLSQELEAEGRDHRAQHRGVAARNLSEQRYPDPQWMEIREFICPECGTMHEVEAAAPGYPIVHDFEPDLEGFYREWLGKPL